MRLVPVLVLFKAASCYVKKSSGMSRVCWDKLPPCILFACKVGDTVDAGNFCLEVKAASAFRESGLAILRASVDLI